MAHRPALVIVESPAKARTIAGFLGKDYVVESSIGHIRDLPKTASDIPEALKKMPWARLGVDVDNDFKPLYLISPDKKQQIAKLKTLLAGASEVYLATDEDREGESIAWHLLEVLKPKVPVKRMVFHEITKSAIQKALASTREVDRRLVDAQETRRILDRLYGYEVSPVLWKKVMRGLSAGRVQSVATRIVVERELARMRFRAAQYWGIDATFQEAGIVFSAGVTGIDAQRLATGKDFDEKGKLTRDGVLHLLEPRAREVAAGLKSADIRITSIERKPSRRSPAPPFMTSTLQQEAGRKLRVSAKQAMSTAQSLYERGYITYMRADSESTVESAVASARASIGRLYGADYLPDAPRQYTKKVKNAQEAHEAIRPAGDVFRTPEEVAREVDYHQARLYELIWMRTIASQMKDALGESVQVKMEALAEGKTASGTRVELAASGHTQTFPGFLRAYVEGSDDPTAELESKERALPKLTEGQVLRPSGVDPKFHETAAPARFTEASLVQKLEELGVGRPSTYASILNTIVDRGYAWKKGTALVPSFRAFAVIALLEKHFGALVDYAFTAKMEDDLDAIAGGTEESVPYLRRFYFGSEGTDSPVSSGRAKRVATQAVAGDKGAGLGLKSLVADRLDEIDARAINSLPLGADDQGREVVVRVGRYGPYLQRGEDTTSIPDDMPPDELTVAKATELLAAPRKERELGNDPKTGKPVFLRSGKYGPYVQLGEAEPMPTKKPAKKGSKAAAAAKAEGPKTASLLPRHDPATLELAEALRLLSVPRAVGVDPADGKTITAQFGPFGPYIAKEKADGKKDSRNLTDEDQVFTISLDQALTLFATPKLRQRREPAAPLKELGEDPVSKKPIIARSGKFGIYVTDGTTNASLRREDSLERLTPERAQELLQERRDKEASGVLPPPKKTAAKRPGAKRPAKKA